MTTARWALPTVSVIAAVALAVGGGLIGSSFAEHTTNQVSSGTEQVPVLAPVSIGVPPADDSATRPDGSYSVSEAVAEREVRLPASDPSALDPELLDLIGTLTEADDPAAKLNFLGWFGDFYSSGASGNDDPCAPRDDSDASECPEGLQSTVLPLLGRPDFLVNASPFPPTEAEYRADPDDTFVWCDGLSASPGSVPLGIVSSVPATFTVRYWPSAHPDEAAELETIETSAEETANFEEALLVAEDSRGIPLIHHCATFDGLEPDTAYTAVVNGIDTEYRLSAPVTLRFNSSGAPTHPGARIVPVGENLVFVSALHPSGQSVDIRAVVRQPDAIPTCSEIESGMSLTALTDTESETTVDKLVAARVPEDFLNKHAVTFAAPEGSTLLVCARWYEAGGAPSWQRVQPLFESSAIVQAPDRLDPIVELSAVAARQSVVDNISIGVSTERGRWCGGNIWRSTDTADRLPLLLCDSTGNTGSAKVDSRGYFGDRGASNDLVLRIDTGFHDGDSSSTRAYIASVDGGCRGECSLPEARYYVLPLGATEQPTGLCGASFGDCTPPTAETSVGTIQVKVSWEQGDTNGRSTWYVTPTSDVAPEYSIPDEPQFNLDGRWSFDDPEYSHRNARGVLLPEPFVSGHFTLNVDRPVDYTVRYTEGPGLTLAERCNDEGGPLEVSGHSEGFSLVDMPGVCVGSTYFAELELVDADGNRTVWNLQDRAHYWGAASIHTPGVQAKLGIAVTAGGLSGSVLSVFSLAVGEAGFASENTRSGTCLEDGLFSTSGVRDVSLSSVVYVSLSIQIRSGSGSETPCGAFGSVPTKNLRAQIPLADLYTPEGVTLEYEDA